MGIFNSLSVDCCGCVPSSYVSPLNRSVVMEDKVVSRKEEEEEGDGEVWE